MRIAMIAGPYVSVPPSKYGGTELVIYHAIKGLQELGHEVILIGPGDSTVDCEIIPTVQTAISFPKNNKELRAYTKLETAALRETRRAVQSLIGSVDILHSHGFDLSPFAWYPNLTTLHNMFQFADLPYYLSRLNLYYASISRNQQRALPFLRYVRVVYNGEDPDRFPIVQTPEDYLCFLGRFDRDKNPHVAIELAVSLGMKIKLAGKVDYRGDDYFRSVVSPYFDHPLVEYLGELGPEDKTTLLANAKCNLHPTNFREPFGLTVLEAAYCGTPTLAVARGSMPELIEPGRTGMLVEDFIEGFAAVETCFGMDRRYIADRARKRFNYRVMAESYVDAYSRVLRSFRHGKRLRLPGRGGTLYGESLDTAVRALPAS